MTSAVVRDVVFWLTAAGAVFSAWRVFRTDSMVRAAYWLMASFVGVGVILVLLGAEFLGLVLLLMMAGEMTIMAVFMVMLMMNPAGLNPMIMVHQHRTAIAAGVVAFLGLGAVGLLGRFPAAPAPPGSDVTAQLGRELLGDSMLIFETAGVTLLATMIGAIAIASRRGRYGTADEGSAEPAVEDAPPSASTAAPATAPPPDEDEHAGHAMAMGATGETRGAMEGTEGMEGMGSTNTTGAAAADHAAMGHGAAPAADDDDEHEGHGGHGGHGGLGK